MNLVQTFFKDKLSKILIMYWSNSLLLGVVIANNWLPFMKIWPKNYRHYDQISLLERLIQQKIK